MLNNHTNAQNIIGGSEKVVRGELYLVLVGNFNPLFKANALDCLTIWTVESPRKTAAQDMTTVRTSSNSNI